MNFMLSSSKAVGEDSRRPPNSTTNINYTVQDGTGRHHGSSEAWRDVRICLRQARANQGGGKRAGKAGKLNVARNLESSPSSAEAIGNHPPAERAPTNTTCRPPRHREVRPLHI